MDGMTHCCWIFTPSLSCDTDAEFAIYENPEFPDGDTYACEHHVGVLLGSADGREKPTKEWTVVYIGGDDAAE
jgi:hypothetical protein